MAFLIRMADGCMCVCESMCGSQGVYDGLSCLRSAAKSRSVRLALTDNSNALRGVRISQRGTHTAYCNG